MPGDASLASSEYYAHPQNAFWRIIGTLHNFDPALAYEKRVAALKASGIAVWDVLATCERTGSLDSAIDRASEVANDFESFFANHPSISRVFFNGGIAEALFKRHRGSLYRDSRLTFVRLPSTSPAHAGMRYEEKLARWREALRY
jgi:double-stranded uracil-DNA glycosylase